MVVIAIIPVCFYALCSVNTNGDLPRRPSCNWLAMLKVCVGVRKRITVCKNVCVCVCRAAGGYNKRSHLHKLHGARRGCTEENNKEEKRTNPTLCRQKEKARARV